MEHHIFFYQVLYAISVGSLIVGCTSLFIGMVIACGFGLSEFKKVASITLKFSASFVILSLILAYFIK